MSSDKDSLSENTSWEMIEDKDIKIQINEYHKLLEDIKAENIVLPDEFVSKLPKMSFDKDSLSKNTSWEMIEDKDIKIQINEYHKLLEDIKVENIVLPDEFVSKLLIEKLLQSWTDYKQQLKHKHKQMSLPDLITHIIIEDTSQKGV